MTVGPDTLEHLILYQADDDWLAIGNLNYYASFFEKELPIRRPLALAAIRVLAEAGYIRIGDLEYRDPETKTGLHWVEWPGSLDEQLARLVEVFTPEVEDDRYWYYGCWLNLTDSGEEVVQALPEPDDRFFEGLI